MLTRAEQNFCVRFIRLSGNMALVLEGGVEPTTGAGAFVEQLAGRQPALCQCPSHLISAHGGAVRSSLH